MNVTNYLNAIARFNTWQANLNRKIMNDKQAIFDKIEQVLPEEDRALFRRLQKVQPNNVLGRGVCWVLHHELTLEGVIRLIRELREQYNLHAHHTTNLLGFNLEHPEL
jgi:hypothetical protein